MRFPGKFVVNYYSEEFGLVDTFNNFTLKKEFFKERIFIFRLLYTIIKS